MLKCRNLKKAYGEHLVVNDLSFEVKRGEVFAFLGSNGAGKTTTIKMILGLTKPDSGEITLAENIQIGYSPETPYFPPFLSAGEVLEYYAGIQKISKEKREEDIIQLLTTVGLKNDNTKVKNYSKGMIQRLSFAQAMLGNPDLLLLDEPTAGLDALGRLELMQLIANLKERGKTILIISHILSDMERMCDSGMIVKEGALLGLWNKRENHRGKSLEDIFLELTGGIGK